MSFKTSVIGLGYLGTTQAVILAKMGHSVIGIDTDKAKVESLSSGKLTFFEPGLAEMLGEMLSSGRLRFVASYPEELREVDIHFLCVGTPREENSDEVDLSAIIDSATALAKFLSPDALVLGRSTVPVGTAEKVRRLLSEETGSKQKVAWNPEFLSEGTAIRDSLKPERIVIGVDDKESETILRQLYKPLTDSGVPLLAMDTRTSELVKVASNSFLATKVSFINGVASVAESVGASTTLLAEAMGLDPRIGSQFLRNGLGFGGGCLPKDVAGFQMQAQKAGASEFASLLQSVSNINRSRVQQTLKLAETLIPELSGKSVAILGASFKPNTDDTRESPGLTVARELFKIGALVAVHDPVVKLDNSLEGLVVSSELDLVIKEADLVIIATDWPTYKELDPFVLGKTVRSKYLIDGRGVIDIPGWQAAGWTVLALGEGTPSHG